jgi:hypothetical protein
MSFSLGMCKQLELIKLIYFLIKSLILKFKIILRVFINLKLTSNEQWAKSWINYSKVKLTELPWENSWRRHRNYKYMPNKEYFQLIWVFLGRKKQRNSKNIIIYWRRRTSHLKST